MILIQNHEFTLRTFRPEDSDRLYALLSDPEVMRHLENPYSRAASDAFLLQAGMTIPPLVYAVENRQGQFLGYVIYHAYDGYSMEIGWVLQKCFWGRGYTGRLTDLLIRLAKEAGKDAVLECESGQLLSRRIAESHGFELAGQSGGRLVYRRSCRSNPA